MQQFADVSAVLKRSLGLPRSPVAVSLADEVPEGVRRWEGAAPAGCRFWQEAARGPFATSTPDHELCSIGVYTHNLAGPSVDHRAELGQVLQAMAGMEYVRDEDVAQIPVLAASRRHVVYAPLEKAPLPPDAVLLFVNPAQGLVLAEAVQQVDAAAPPALGRPTCARVPQVVNSGRPAVSLGCCGARAYLDALADDIALWGLPGPEIAAYAARVETLAVANRTLARFHELRGRDVREGQRPTYAQSLARLSDTPPAG